MPRKKKSEEEEVVYEDEDIEEGNGETEWADEITEEDEKRIKSFEDALGTTSKARSFLQIVKEGPGRNGGTLNSPCGTIPIRDMSSEEDVRAAIEEKFREKKGPGNYLVFLCDTKKRRIPDAPYGIFEFEPTKEEARLMSLEQTRKEIDERKEIIKGQREIEKLERGGTFSEEIAELKGDLKNVLYENKGGGGGSEMMMFMMQQMQNQQTAVEKAREEAERQRRHELLLIQEQRKMELEKEERKREYDEKIRREQEEKNEIRRREEQRAREEVLKLERERLAMEKERMAEELKAQREEAAKREREREADLRAEREFARERATRENETHVMMLKTISEATKNHNEELSALSIQNVQLMNEMTANQVKMANTFFERLGVLEKPKSNTFDKLLDVAGGALEKAMTGWPHPQQQQPTRPMTAQPVALPTAKVIEARPVEAAEASSAQEVSEAEKLLTMLANDPNGQRIMGRFVQCLAEKIEPEVFVNELSSLGEWGEFAKTRLRTEEWADIKRILLSITITGSDNVRVPYVTDGVKKVLQSTEAGAWWRKFTDILVGRKAEVVAKPEPKPEVEVNE